MTALTGQVAVVTGAGTGIGRAVAEHLATRGATVVVAARTASKLDALVADIRSAGGKALAIPTDVTVEDEVEHLFSTVDATFDRIDVLINNAGIMRHGRLVDQSASDIDDVVATNLRGTVLCTRAAARLMRPRGRGKIVNVGSMFATAPVKTFSIYGATKAAIDQFTRIVALELADANIQVNTLAPGYVLTDLNSEDFEDRELRAAVERRIPAGRIADPADLLPLVELLCTAGSDYMTGESVRIDGGYALG